MSAPSDSCVATFATALRAAGGTLRTVPGGHRAADEVERIVRCQSPPYRLLYEPCGFIDELGLTLACRARGIRLVPVVEAGISTAEFQVGLTGAPIAIAETGSVLVGGLPGGWGLASVLPWVHIVILRRRDLQPDLATAFGVFQHRFQAGERDWVWITGPSKTADIAKTLVLGIHGPNALKVILVDEVGDREP